MLLRAWWCVAVCELSLTRSEQTQSLFVKEIDLYIKTFSGEWP